VFFLDTPIEGEIKQVIKNDYYAIEIIGDNNIIIDNWKALLESIRNCITQLDISTYKCGDLFFRNGIEIAYEFTEIDWMSVDEDDLDMDAYKDIYNLDLRLSICLK
jgi:hypothetical protein